MIIGIINIIVEQISNIVSLLLMVLPKTPFQWGWVESLTTHEFWGYVNYFIPFDVIALIIVSYTVSVGLWYGLRWLLRFVRYIG